MESNINEFIRKKKRKKNIKKYTMFTIFSIVVIFILMTKLPIFNIVTVQYSNNKIVASEELAKLYNPVGKNIFLLNMKTLNNKYKVNPYIEDVKVKKKLPNKIIIDVNEKDATYYMKEKDKYYVLSNKLMLLEIRDNIKGLNLIETDNISIKNHEVGSTIIDDKNVVEISEDIADLMKRNKSDIKFDKIDFSNNQKITAYIHDIRIIIGDNSDLEKKFNIAINILNSDAVTTGKGYINVENLKAPIIYNEEYDDKNNKDVEGDNNDNKQN